jgi:glutamine synthetase
MSVRLEAIRTIGKRTRKLDEQLAHSIQFGSKVFSHRLMEQTLPKKVFQHLLQVTEGKEKLDSAHADLIAAALKDWAVKEGATHFTHWFQPLTGASGEKHDSFLNWSGKGTVIESFHGKDLLRGEPDASSFPSGGLRMTHQARGYTVWDPASLPFLWKGGDGITLCIPSLFFSWTGLALDHKIPLLRSDEKINASVQRLLKLCAIPASRVFSTLGLEQEYFAIDRSLYLLRPDLLLAGRTVYGARSPKGQELEDHYFGPVKDRVMAFMREFEEEAVRLGIPVKTRHNEVAPAQHEIAPLFESAAAAVDHNLLLMELMWQIALEHGLACLMHEKPFAGLNGSGKHNNWSLATDTGLNLLDPRENSLLFLTLLAAILRAVHDHAGLMRASIGSAGNDHRLGGSEAPPTILSVYLGEKLEKLVDSLIEEKPLTEDAVRQIDLGLAHVPLYEADASDRNRTSFFAFTGNKFEFRAVGASAHSAFPTSVINAIVADSLHLILDEIEDLVKDRKLTQEELLKEALPCIRKHLSASRAVLFSGNAYTPDWEREAQQRGLPNIRKSFHAFAQILDKRTQRVFEGILSHEELHSRYEVLIERYAKTMQIEANLMIDLFRTQILPAALLDQKRRTQLMKNLSDLGISSAPHLLQSIKSYSAAIESAIFAVDEIEKVQTQAADFGWEAKGKTYSEILGPKMESARVAVDHLETIVDNALWPLPKYREMLFVT